MADGHIEGNNLVCGLHGWDYRYDTGVSSYNNTEFLKKFTHIIKEKGIYLKEKEIDDFLKKHPQSFKKEEYLGKYADTHPENTEPYTLYIKELAQNGLSKNRTPRIFCRYGSRKRKTS